MLDLRENTALNSASVYLTLSVCTRLLFPRTSCLNKENWLKMRIMRTTCYVRLFSPPHLDAIQRLSKHILQQKIRATIQGLFNAMCGSAVHVVPNTQHVVTGKYAIISCQNFLYVIYMHSHYRYSIFLLKDLADLEKIRGQCSEVCGMRYILKRASLMVMTKK
jgi:hypothetical protein